MALEPDLDLLFDDDVPGKETVVYEAPGADPASVEAVFDEGKGLGLGLDRGEDMDDLFRPGLAEYSVMYLRKDEVTTRPPYRSKLTREDSTEWTVQQAKDDGVVWKCWISEDQRGRTRG